MSDLISKQKAIDEIRAFQEQVTLSGSSDWINGMDEGFDHAVGVIELMDTNSMNTLLEKIFALTQEGFEVKFTDVSRLHPDTMLIGVRWHSYYNQMLVTSDIFCCEDPEGVIVDLLDYMYETTNYAMGKEKHNEQK